MNELCLRLSWSVVIFDNVCGVVLRRLNKCLRSVLQSCFAEVVIFDCVCGILCCDDLMSIGASIQECVFLIITVVFLNGISQLLCHHSILFFFWFLLKMFKCSRLCQSHFVCWCGVKSHVFRSRFFPGSTIVDVMEIAKEERHHPV